ncbi:MAG: hypothetical protein AB1458_16190, partial [Bacteroidota bacterium]
VLFSNLLRLAWVMYTDRPYGAIVGNFPFRLDSFLIGVGLAAIKIFYVRGFEKMSRLGFFIPAVLAFVSLLYVFAGANGGHLKEDELLWVRTVWFSAVSAGIALLLPFFCNSQYIDRISGNRILNFAFTWLSFLSYPIYLVHLEIYKLMDRFFPEIYTWYPALAFVAKNVPVVVLSLILYFYVHEPFISLRQKILAKSKKKDFPAVKEA